MHSTVHWLRVVALAVDQPRAIPCREMMGPVVQVWRMSSASGFQQPEADGSTPPETTLQSVLRLLLCTRPLTVLGAR